MNASFPDLNESSDVVEWSQLDARKTATKWREIEADSYRLKSAEGTLRLVRAFSYLLTRVRTFRPFICVFVS